MEMKTRMAIPFRRVCWAVVLVAAAAAPAVAHHSFAAQYDSSKPTSLKGTVTKMEWTNPHARFYLDVKEKDGTVKTWEFELGSPNTLIRYGWNRDVMKIGSEVVADGFLAKDGSRLANAKTVTFADGRVVNAGSSADLTATK